MRFWVEKGTNKHSSSLVELTVQRERDILNKRTPSECRVRTWYNDHEGDRIPEQDPLCTGSHGKTSLRGGYGAETFRLSHGRRWQGIQEDEGNPGRRVR